MNGRLFTLALDSQRVPLEASHAYTCMLDDIKHFLQIELVSTHSLRPVAQILFNCTRGTTNRTATSSCRTPTNAT